MKPYKRIADGGFVVSIPARSACGERLGERAYDAFEMGVVKPHIHIAVFCARICDYAVAVIFGIFVYTPANTFRVITRSERR